MWVDSSADSCFWQVDRVQVVQGGRGGGRVRLHGHGRLRHDLLHRRLQGHRSGHDRVPHPGKLLHLLLLFPYSLLNILHHLLRCFARKASSTPWLPCGSRLPKPACGPCFTISQVTRCPSSLNESGKKALLLAFHFPCPAVICIF